MKDNIKKINDSILELIKVNDFKTLLRYIEYFVKHGTIEEIRQVLYATYSHRNNTTIDVMIKKLSNRYKLINKNMNYN